MQRCLAESERYEEEDNERSEDGAVTQGVRRIRMLAMVIVVNGVLAGRTVSG